MSALYVLRGYSLLLHRSRSSNSVEDANYQYPWTDIIYSNQETCYVPFFHQVLLCKFTLDSMFGFDESLFLIYLTRSVEQVCI